MRAPEWRRGRGHARSVRWPVEPAYRPGVASGASSGLSATVLATIRSSSSSAPRLAATPRARRRSARGRAARRPLGVVAADHVELEPLTEPGTERADRRRAEHDDRRLAVAHASVVAGDPDHLSDDRRVGQRLGVSASRSASECVAPRALVSSGARPLRAQPALRPLVGITFDPRRALAGESPFRDRPFGGLVDAERPPPRPPLCLPSCTIAAIPSSQSRGDASGGRSRCPGSTIRRSFALAARFVQLDGHVAPALIAERQEVRGRASGELLSLVAPAVEREGRRSPVDRGLHAEIWGSTRSQNRRTWRGSRSGAIASSISAMKAVSEGSRGGGMPASASAASRRSRASSSGTKPATAVPPDPLSSSPASSTK